MAKSDKPDALFQWVTKTTDYEERALSMLKPIDVRNIDPVVVNADKTGDLKHLYRYWRITLSSAGQGVKEMAIGRASGWFVIDRNSGGLLGIFNLTDINLPWKPFDQWFGHTVGSNTPHKTSNHVIQIKRCLPIFEFGELTGGKLLFLLATSTEVIESHELRYSFPVVILLIKTLHGRGSQYNRLHARGLDYAFDYGEDGKGLYVMKLRPNYEDTLLERSHDPGPLLTYPYADQVAYWKQRWLPNRMDRTQDGWIYPNPDRYRLSMMINEKVDLRVKG
jgi:hypothetical protein